MKIDYRFLEPYVTNEQIKEYTKRAIAALQTLKSRNGAGNDFLGWLDLPSEYNNDFENEMLEAVNKLKTLDAVVVVGIGGSYLGAKAVIDALTNPFEKKSPEIIYAGNQLSESYHKNLLNYLSKKQFGIVVISKSGTTTEPAIVFRMLRDLLVKNAGKDVASNRIIAITDKSKGALRLLSDKENYKTFEIADNVGGRYSVLSPVGLVPIALAGVDIAELMKGAKLAANEVLSDKEDNAAVKYAAIRNILLDSGKPVEIMVAYEPGLQYFAEWWKQLYGESEGKGHKGLFPASVQFTTDLHSMGQYIQDGQRIMFETVLSVENSSEELLIPSDDQNFDKLNYLSGKSLHYVNSIAQIATAEAHFDGGVPVLRIEIPELNAYQIGYLIYMFEVACAISGYMLGVNPFDQPGVEAYKKNMFRMLGKE